MSVVGGIEEYEANRDNFVLKLSDALKSKEIGNGIEFDDKFLLKFLRSRNYKIEETCEMIKNYISIFKKYPQYFEGVDLLKSLYEDGIFCVIPEKNPSGETVAVLRPGLWNPRSSPFDDVMFTTINGYELAELDESMQINGGIEVIDCAGIGMRHFLKVGIREIRLGIEMTEESLPIRWRKICIINENSIVDLVWSIAKQFMSKQLRETFMFCGYDMSKLHEIVSPKILPPIYGGTSDKYNPVEYFKLLKNSESQLMNLWEPFKSYHQKR